MKTRFSNLAHQVHKIMDGMNKAYSGLCCQVVSSVQ